MSDAQVTLDPHLPIVDAHHHLWVRPGSTYLVEDLKQDLDSGHDIVATVYVQAHLSMYRTTGPERLKPVGEVEFVVASAKADRAKFGTKANICEGISGFADLLDPSAEEVLEALISAGDGHLRGIRHNAARDLNNNFGKVRPALGLLLDPAFQKNFSLIAQHDLVFETMVYHPQLTDVLSLARSFPDTTLVLNHVGAPVGAGTYNGHRDEVFRVWSSSIRELSSCPNVVVKLGGFGMPLMGFGFDTSPAPAQYQELASAWRPYIEHCIEMFGAERCMFESNFPVDKVSCDYRTLWNTFKYVVKDASSFEKASLFSETARRIYRLQDESPAMASPSPLSSTVV